jgi:hypothetical protein
MKTIPFTWIPILALIFGIGSLCPLSLSECPDNFRRYARIELPASQRKRRANSVSFIRLFNKFSFPSLVNLDRNAEIIKRISIFLTIQSAILFNLWQSFQTLVPKQLPLKYLPVEKSDLPTSSMLVFGLSGNNFILFALVGIAKESFIDSIILS